MQSQVVLRDFTHRLSCRSGDYLLLCGLSGDTFLCQEEYTIKDIWQLSDGDSVTITNRQQDLPSWFELHPLEVSNTLVNWMNEKLKSGYKPGEIIEGPNIWRALCGERLVWVGKARQGQESNNGILAIYTFNENAIIIGESIFETDIKNLFGGFNQENQTEEDLALVRIGWQACKKLGTPRNMSFDGKWNMG